MWGTQAFSEKKVNTLVFSAKAALFWSKHNKDLMKFGSPPSISHPSKFATRLTQHMYLKQTHDGKIIAGGDRMISNADETTNEPIRPEWNHANKTFAEGVLPFLKDHQVKDSWTGLMPFTKDGCPIVGKISCLPGEVYIITGMSSAGLMKGPGAGEMLAEMMTGCQKSK